MNIVILQGTFLPIPPLLGGAVEKNWFSLGSSFRKMGHRVTHISRTYENLPVQEKIDNVDHVRVRGYNRSGKKYLDMFSDLIYSWTAISAMPKADIIITNSFWSPFFLRWRRRGSIMVSVERIPKGQLFLYGKPNAFRAPSKTVQAAIANEMPHAKIYVIPNPLPSPGISDGEKLKKILFCGRIHPEKGLDILLKAFRGFSTAHPEWVLQIVGSEKESLGGGGGEYLTKLKALSASLPVEWTGFINDHHELNKIYCKSSIFVYPSLAESGETFGSSVLEAMSNGSVPVVSNLSCFSDFIKNEENGLIFNHRNQHPDIDLLSCLEKLASNNSAHLEAMRKNALLVNESHSCDSIARQFINVFEEMISP